MNILFENKKVMATIEQKHLQFISKQNQLVQQVLLLLIIIILLNNL